MFGRARRAAGTLPNLAIFLCEAEKCSGGNRGGEPASTGFRPYYDRSCTKPVLPDDAACTTDGVVYCGLDDGPGRCADLPHPELEVGSRVFVVPEPSNAVDPNALAVLAIRGRNVLTAGYLPKDLAAALAPIAGNGGEGLVVETIVRDQSPVGLRILASFGRRMSVEGV